MTDAVRARRMTASLLMLLAAGPAFAWTNAGPDEGQKPAHCQGKGHAECRELSNAVRRIVRANLGQVLSVERIIHEGRPVNRIKVLDDEGRVRIYIDDPHRDETREVDPGSR